MQPDFNFWRYKFRPFKWDDLYGVQALINVISQYDPLPQYYSLEWLHTALSQPEVKAEENCFVATIETDRLVGFSRIEAGCTPTCYMVIAGVHPDFRGMGIGRGLIAISDFNLMANHSGDSSLRVRRQSSPTATSDSSLLAYVGYHRIKSDDDTRLLWEKQLY